MHAEERGRKLERQAAINHFLELSWQRNAEIEDDFYHGVKETFGPSAFVGVHPTWAGGSLGPAEISKNGWNWWAVTRDYGQTDEFCPYGIRTSLAKKWGGGVFYNMYYSDRLENYPREVWQCALGGGRVHWHPTFVKGKRYEYPNEKKYIGVYEPLLRGELMRGECRVRLLNFISRSPVDCPVAVIFGHALAMNWSVIPRTKKGEWIGWDIFDGINLVQTFWYVGYPADLIPSSETGGKVLRVGSDGYVYYGPQRYAAMVLYYPEMGKPETVSFWKAAAAGGKTALYRVSDWTSTFDGKPFDGNAVLPSSIKVLADLPADPRWMKEYNFVGPASGHIVRTVTGDLQGIAPQETINLAWGSPFMTGSSRLIDGTEIVVQGDDKEMAGLPVQTNLTIGGREVEIDGVGIAAVRLDSGGKLEALAIGGLKRFKGGGVSIELAERVDVALWRDRQSKWRGVLQGYRGPVPAVLATLAADWLRLDIPPPLPQEHHGNESNN